MIQISERMNETLESETKISESLRSLPPKNDEELIETENL